MGHNVPVRWPASLFILPLIVTVQAVALGLIDNPRDRAQPGTTVADPFAARAVAYIRERSEKSTVIHTIVHSAPVADGDIRKSDTISCCATGVDCPYHLVIAKGEFDMRRIIGSGLSDGSVPVPAEYVAMLFEEPDDPGDARVRTIASSPDRARFAKILDTPSPTDCP